jgi:DNA-binding NarL/FixJ family response regulator
MMREAVAAEVNETRIFVVDDHPIVRRGLVQLIEQESDLKVCGEASSAEQALQSIPRVRPHLAIVDISLQGTSGIELLKRLKIEHPELPVLVISMHDESLYAERALRAGARGYIMKHEAITTLQTAIRRVAAGGIFLSERMTERLLEKATGRQNPPGPTGVESLSDRELEVFELIGRGHRTSEIARRLCLSVKTIETYRAKIKDKLHLRSGAELVQHAVSWVQGR